MFSLEAPGGTDVAIAGSFNDWTQVAMTKGQDGLWRITIQLARGTYEYRFQVDTVWRQDPSNPRGRTNDVGGYDSICDVL